jgi:hypothetical protein
MELISITSSISSGVVSGNNNGNDYVGSIDHLLGWVSFDGWNIVTPMKQNKTPVNHPSGCKADTLE